MVVPADCMHLEGDTVAVDTAPLTGEPIPWKVPRPDDHGKPEGSGKLLLAGCTIMNGECYALVELTGTNTEIGAAAAMVAESSGADVPEFEAKVMVVVQGVIVFALVIAVVMFLVSHFVHKIDVRDSLLAALAMLIGAVPIALPLVILVTMAIGSKIMAENRALVTSLADLQDIASMTVLNSDKTGTLTTAKISIIGNRIYAHEGFTEEDVFKLAVVAANRDNADDAIDGAIIRSWDQEKGGTEQGKAAVAGFKVTKLVGFNNGAKRTCCYATDEQGNEIMIGKGIVSKILRCEPRPGEEDGEEGTHPQWTVENCDAISNDIVERDAQLASDGYKTIAICRQVLPNGPMQLVGVLPMMDPVRGDTAETIQKVRNCGIKVKMITGDHLNIAKSTALDCNLGNNILPNTALWPASHSRDKLIEDADGFAQVMPKDKRECVLALKGLGYICGMTGDGVNDAPALAEAQIGIAVEGSTDAAKNAADIQLLSSGLGAIYTAVVESRKIFRRLKSYVIYRLSATIQIVVVLGVITLERGCSMNPTYVILLAIFNDVTMLPLSSDNQKASRNPERPNITGLIIMSGVIGLIEAIASLVYAYALHGIMYQGNGAGNPSLPCTSVFNKKTMHPQLTPTHCTTCDAGTQVAIFLQMFLSAEFLIFSMRTTGPFCLDMPTPMLLVSVIGACIIASIWAGVGIPPMQSSMPFVDIVYTWLYTLAVLILIDVAKRILLQNIEGTVAVIDENEVIVKDNTTRPNAISVHRKSIGGHSTSIQTGPRGSVASSGGRKSISGRPMTQRAVSQQQTKQTSSKSIFAGTTGSRSRGATLSKTPGARAKRRSVV